jgi:hypothetical protein
MREFYVRVSPVMALFRRKFRLTACATTGG